MADRSSRSAPQARTTEGEVESPGTRTRAEPVEREARRPPDLPDDALADHDIGRIEGMPEDIASIGETVTPAGADMDGEYGQVADLDGMGPGTDDPDLGVDLPDDSGPLGTTAGPELHGLHGDYSPASDITATGPGWDDVTPEQMTGTIWASSSPRRHR